ncbi:MAG: ATP-binding protein, partial [Bryobacterales bacterium]|nr:ATP-binding protein [Bryobacterales bacterium]
MLAGVAIVGFLGSLYFLVAPEPPLQRELVAATDHSPPFQIVQPDGRVGGAVVEALNIAAERAGIRIHWKHMEVRPDDVLRDLDSGVDLWPMVTTTPDRKEAYHLTQPIGRAEYIIVAIDDGNLDLKTFRPQRVAITAGQWLRAKLAEDFPQAAPVIVKSGQQLVTLCEGRADALIADAASLYSMSFSQPASCAGKRLSNRLMLGWYWDLAIGSTFARAAEADRLRAEFGYLARTGALHEVFADFPIQAQYRSQDTFAETHAELEARRARWVLTALCICCLALLGLVMETHRRTADAMRLVQLKSNFLDRMSHELRTPLNGVLGLASLLSTTPLNPQQRDYLRLIRQSGEQLLKLVSDSLALSRLSAGKHENRAAIFRPRNLVEDTMAVLAPLAQDRKLDLVWVVERSVPQSLLGDDRTLQQLLINLTGNAIKYTPAGTVRVHMRLLSAQAPFPFLRCEVDDSGPGIPARDRERIFDQFVRLERPGEQTIVGTGLGLAIAKELIVLLGGTIGVSESVYGGARFWFECPVEAVTAATGQPVAGLTVRVLTPSLAAGEQAFNWDRQAGIEDRQAGIENRQAGMVDRDLSIANSEAPARTSHAASQAVLVTEEALHLGRSAAADPTGRRSAPIEAGCIHLVMTEAEMATDAAPAGQGLRAVASDGRTGDSSHPDGVLFEEPRRAGGEAALTHSLKRLAMAAAEGESPDRRRSQAAPHVGAPHAGVSHAGVSHEGVAYEGVAHEGVAHADVSGRGSAGLSATMEMLTQFLEDTGRRHRVYEGITEAIAHAADAPAPELVVLEGAFPDGDLMRIATQLRAGYGCPHLPLLVYGPVSDSDATARVLPRGILRLPRPFLSSRFNHLLEHLHADLALETSPMQPPETVAERPADADALATGGERDLDATPALSAGPADATDDPAVLTPGKGGALTGYPSEPVLVADDNPVNRLVLAAMLRRLGLRVVEAEDGAQALRQSTQEPFSFFILDHQMPVMD